VHSTKSREWPTCFGVEIGSTADSDESENATIVELDKNLGGLERITLISWYGVDRPRLESTWE
jgi:hypothetical protein